MGPFSAIFAKAWRCSSFSFEGLPGALMLTSPAGPRSLNRTTQSRTICKVTLPILAASVREPPS